MLQPDPYELLDFVFFLIAGKKSVSANTLFYEYQTELLQKECDEDHLHSVLIFLLKDQKIYQAGEEYRLTEAAKQFPGYAEQAKRDAAKAKKKTNWEKTWKILPIVGSLLFGAFGVYSTLQNQEKDRSIKQLESTKTKLSLIIDSLSK